ncbi:MAG: DoxX family membrane protein [Candidatus Omnitrophica bacterium]|nr:DoxX family membrane protein [Candidatus Omnitrophota bacterium]
MNQPKFDKILAHPYAVIVLRVLVGGIMIFAGWSKLIDMAGMAESIENYRILPSALVNIPAIILPAIELIAGVCLIAGIWIDGALLIVTGLFVVFIAAIQSAIWRGLNIECGCFGLSDSEIVGAKVLIRDSLFVLATVPIWLSRIRGDESQNLQLEEIASELHSDV